MRRYICFLRLMKRIHSLSIRTVWWGNNGELQIKGAALYTRLKLETMLELWLCCRLTKDVTSQWCSQPIRGGSVGRGPSFRGYPSWLPVLESWVETEQSQIMADRRHTQTKIFISSGPQNSALKKASQHLETFKQGNISVGEQVESTLHEEKV